MRLMDFLCASRYRAVPTHIDEHTPLNTSLSFSFGDTFDKLRAPAPHPYAGGLFELECQINAWREDCATTEHAGRIIAAKRIIQCLRSTQIHPLLIEWGFPIGAHLDLRGLGLDSLPMGIFSKLSNLQTLNLADNYFSELPTDLAGNAPKLRRLWLNNNRLTRFRADQFKQMPQLEVFGFRGNQWKNLPESIAGRAPHRWTWLHCVQVTQRDF